MFLVWGEGKQNFRTNRLREYLLNCGDNAIEWTFVKPTKMALLARATGVCGVCWLSDWGDALTRDNVGLGGSTTSGGSGGGSGSSDVVDLYLKSCELQEAEQEEPSHP